MSRTRNYVFATSECVFATSECVYPRYRLTHARTCSTRRSTTRCPPQPPSPLFPVDRSATLHDPLRSSTAYPCSEAACFIVVTWCGCDVTRSLTILCPRHWPYPATLSYLARRFSPFLPIAPFFSSAFSSFSLVCSFSLSPCDLFFLLPLFSFFPFLPSLPILPFESSSFFSSSRSSSFVFTLLLHFLGFFKSSRERETEREESGSAIYRDHGSHAHLTVNVIFLFTFVKYSEHWVFSVSYANIAHCFSIY